MIKFEKLAAGVVKVTNDYGTVRLANFHDVKVKRLTKGDDADPAISLYSKDLNIKYEFKLSELDGADPDVEVAMDDLAILFSDEPLVP